MADDAEILAEAAKADPIVSTDEEYPHPGMKIRTILRMAEQSVRHGYPLKPEFRRIMVNEGMRILAQADSPRTKISAIRALGALDALNLQREQLGERMIMTATRITAGEETSQSGDKAGERVEEELYVNAPADMLINALAAIRDLRQSMSPAP